MAEVKKVNGNGKAHEPVQAKRGTGWKVREAFRNCFCCIVNDDVKPQDVLHPDFFSLVSRDLRPLDSIEVYPRNHSYLAEYVVLDAGIGWTQVHHIRTIDLPQPTRADPDKLAGYDLERDGASGHWFAVRKDDGAVLGKNAQIRSRQDLIRHVEDHATNAQR